MNGTLAMDQLHHLTMNKNILRFLVEIYLIFFFRGYDEVLEAFLYVFLSIK